MSSTTFAAEDLTCQDIPMPIVRLNRWTVVVVNVLALVLQQPLITTALFVVLLGSVLFGQKGSLIFQVGKRVLDTNTGEMGEDRRLMKFNNTIAVGMLGVAQVAFLAGVPVVGWGLSVVLAVVASIALAGFCLGCFMYFRFKLYRAKLAAKN